jgi:poly-gamma-glutamate synthesis protein (capsule biosynthesis protein)
MLRVYRNIIIVVSVLVVICFATVMIVLYGNKNDKNATIEEQTMLETTRQVSIYLEETNDRATHSTVEEEKKEDAIAETRFLTPEEKYKASDNFVKKGTREKKDTFCFVGDVFLSKKPRTAYDDKGIEGIIDEGYLNILKDSDFNVANLECSITDDTENAENKIFTFALPTEYITPLKEVGFNLFTIANNHILDYGTDSMLNTIKALDENNFIHIGAGKNIEEAKTAYIKEIEGKRYAFLSASSVLPNDTWKATHDREGVFNGYDISELCDEVKKVKPFVDKVIVYMHWGRELETVSNTWQKQYARRIVDAGADLVVGAHPHMVQEIEYYKNVPIVYSLGNFIYGGTMRDTILVAATFDYSIDKNGQLQLIVYPGVSSYEKVKRYWKKEEIVVKIKELQDKSSTCYIGDNGYVFTMEQVAEALSNIANP